jgi:hypothetical protein
MAAVYGNRALLVQRVLEELKIVAYGQPAASVEYEAVDNPLDEILAELAARNIAYVEANRDPTIATIPLEILHPLAQVVGRHVANKFSINADEVNAMFYPEEHYYSPENRCRAVTRNRPHYAPAVPDFF